MFSHWRPQRSLVVLFMLASTCVILSPANAQEQAPTAPADASTAPENSVDSSIEPQFVAPEESEPPPFEASEDNEAKADSSEPLLPPKKEPPAPVVEEPPVIRREREVIDLPKEPEKRWIRHPYAEKGLTKITRDRTYIYKVKPSEQKNASSVRFGIYEPTKLKNPDNGSTFAEFYDGGSAPTVFWDYEWQIWQKFGKFGLKAGSGFFVAQGNGQFENPDIAGPSLQPKESFTFLNLPNSVGAVYRLQLWDRQILVPYAEGGGMAFTFAEIRSDNQSPKFGAALAGYFAGGAALNMNFLDNWAMLELDREYGINNMYLVAELRVVVGGGNFDFSAEVVNAGLLVEF